MQKLIKQLNVKTETRCFIYLRFFATFIYSVINDIIINN